jgi:triphosphatase
VTTEVELKLALPASALREAARLPWLRRLAAAPLSRNDVTSVYFDTRKHKLRKHGVSLRVRDTGSKRLQTIKAQDGGSDGFGRFEREDEITSRRPRLKYAKDTPLAPLVTRKFEKKLRPLFRTKVQRSTLDVRLNDSDIELAFDRGSVAAGKRSEPLHELELELKRGDVQDIAALARRLNEHLPVAFEPRAKADHGYGLVTGEPDAHVCAAPIVLQPRQSAGSAFRQIGLACLRHLAANRRAVIAGDGEGVHQMRVGLRRLRAAISLFRDILHGAEVEDVKNDLKWLTGALAPARDLDVLIKEAVGPLRKANPDEGEIRVLERDMERERKAAFEQARDAVSSPRFREVVVNTALWLIDGRSFRDRASAAAKRGSDTIASVASAILHRRSRKIIKKAKRLKKLDARARHKLRIAVKKLRYGCDFFASLFDDHPKAQRRYRKLLKELQASLGELNDIQVHEGKAHRLTHRRRSKPRQAEEAYALGLLTGGEKQSARCLLSAAEKTGRRLARADAYW